MLNCQLATVINISATTMLASYLDETGARRIGRVVPVLSCAMLAPRPISETAKLGYSLLTGSAGKGTIASSQLLPTP
ncbi:MAG: hypothetical protein JWO42_3847 [Chloroflexi bacterium]|jgi:hypothetical protein|nr:hypothetical protein [Chloroflexota bacterium]